MKISWFIVGSSVCGSKAVSFHKALDFLQQCGRRFPSAFAVLLYLRCQGALSLLLVSHQSVLWPMACIARL